MAFLCFPPQRNTHIPYRTTSKNNSSMQLKLDTYSDGLLPYMMLDENSHSSLQWKLEIYINYPEWTVAKYGCFVGTWEAQECRHFVLSTLENCSLFPGFGHIN